MNLKNLTTANRGGRHATLETTVDFKYVDGVAKDLKIIQEGIPNYDYRVPLEQLGEEGKKIAQGFILQNGTVRTKRLYNAMKYRVTSNSLELYNDAKNSRMQPYAGHIEYGFTGRDGVFRGPWPFMRPAFQMIESMSKGVFEAEMMKMFSSRSGTYGHNKTTPINFNRQQAMSQLGQKYGQGTSSRSWNDYNSYAKAR
jgi:hypothetical protein